MIKKDFKIWKNRGFTEQIKSELEDETHNLIVCLEKPEDEKPKLK